jgi:hypothetical protein
MKRKRRTDSHAMQSSIDCPYWLQKKMRTNLKMAKKDRVNPERAKIAKELLENTKREIEAAVPEAIAKTDTERPLVNVDQHVQPAARTADLKVWQSAKASFRKLARHISGSLKSKRFSWPMYHRA